MVWIWFWRASRHLLKNIHIFWAARGSLRSKFGFPSDTIHMKSGESTIFTLVTVSLFPSERLEAVVLVFFLFSAYWYVTAFTPARKCQNIYSKNKNLGTHPLPKINSTADIFRRASNTHRLDLVILPVRGWPSIPVKGSLQSGVKNRDT